MGNLDRQLEEVLDLLHGQGIHYWLDSGTLLGLKREGELMEQDKDIDIGIWDRDKERVKALFAGIRESGYTICSFSCRGRDFKYNFNPGTNSVNPGSKNNGRKIGSARKIDINIFRKAGQHAWCPMYYFKIKAGGGKRENRTRTRTREIAGFPARLARGIFQGSWNIAISRVPLRIDISSLPWRLFVNLGVWWIPLHYIEEVTHDKSLGVYLPSRWQEYLEFRYGDWQTPREDWVFYRDDGGIRHLDPAEFYAGTGTALDK